MRHSHHALLLFAAIFLALSCQSSQSPTAPESQAPGDLPGVTSARADESPSRYVWGYYRCEVDLDEGTVTVLPSRNAEMHINVNKPLNEKMALGFTIDPSSTPSSGYLVVNVSISHPFPGNPRLTGFDVRGTFLSYGGLDAGGLKIPGGSDPQLLNPDGWSRWWNPTEFTDAGLFGYLKGAYAVHGAYGPPTATVNPYKAFGDALWATADVDFLTTLMLTDPGGRATFSSGKTNVRQYKIQFPVDGGPKIYFDYAIDASWAAPTKNPPTSIPGDFPIWANCMEPFLLQPKVTDCTLVGTPYGGDGGGELELEIEVRDWQGWSNGTYSGQIGEVHLYSPYIAFDPPTVQQVDGLHFTTLSVTAAGKPSIIGTVPVLIEIRAPGTVWKQTGAAAPEGEIAAYARVSVEVKQMECQGDDNVTCDDAEPIDLGGVAEGSVCMPFDPTDHYVFTVPVGKVMEGMITLDNFQYGDNDLILYNGCPGDPIQTSMTPYGQTEYMQVSNLEAGNYFLAVLPGETAGTDVQPYRLSLDVHQAGGQCTTDANNEYTEAGIIGLQETDSETVCAGGDLRDWYRLTVPTDKVAGGTVYLDNGDAGNIDLRVYDEYPGSATFWGSNPGTQDEMVNIDGLGPGAHYIEVVAVGGSPEGDRPFELDVFLVSADYNCTSGDGNDSHLTADPVGYTSVISDSVCFPADPDWFRFTVQEGKVASGTITLSGGMVVDNDLYLYSDPVQDVIEYSAVPGVNDEQVEVDQLEVGTYYIKVCAHPMVGGGDQAYTLTMDLETEEVGTFDFRIHAHIIRRSDGTNPATSEQRVQNDVAWADEFYSQWGGSFTLAEISYINNTAWLAASSNEVYTCHWYYRDKSGPINVYYVNSFPDVPSAGAYCRMDCRYAYQTHNSTYIAMSDNGVGNALAHELGHATGIFHDVYLLDAGFSSCSQINYYYCPYSPNGSFCKESDATYGNLMWFSISGWNDPEDYWLSEYHWQTPALPIESQVENWAYFHTNYPNNF